MTHIGRRPIEIYLIVALALAQSTLLLVQAWAWL